MTAERSITVVYESTEGEGADWGASVGTAHILLDAQFASLEALFEDFVRNGSILHLYAKIGEDEPQNVEVTLTNRDIQLGYLKVEHPGEEKKPVIDQKAEIALHRASNMGEFLELLTVMVAKYPESSHFILSAVAAGYNKSELAA
jgi:hypothetical protein